MTLPNICTTRALIERWLMVSFLSNLTGTEENLSVRITFMPYNIMEALTADRWNNVNQTKLCSSSRSYNNIRLLCFLVGPLLTLRQRRCTKALGIKLLEANRTPPPI